MPATRSGGKVTQLRPNPRPYLQEKAKVTKWKLLMDPIRQQHANKQNEDLPHLSQSETLPPTQQVKLNVLSSTNSASDRSSHS